MKGQQIPLSMALKILAVIAVIIIALAFIMPVLFNFPSLAGTIEKNKAEGAIYTSTEDYSAYLSNIDGFLYPQYPYTRTSLYKYLTRKPIIFMQENCHVCTNCNGNECEFCQYCDSCGDKCITNIYDNCLSCFNCSNNNCNKCVLCTNYNDEPELCKKIKEGISYSYAIKNTIDLDIVTYGNRLSSDTNDIYRDLFREIMSHCLEESIWIEVADGIKQQICIFDPSKFASKNIYEYKDPTYFSNIAFDTSYGKCIIDHPDSSLSKNIAFYDNFDKYTLDNKKSGSIKISLGNVKRNSDGTCAVDIALCNQYSIAYTSEDSTMKILNFFRYFDWSQPMIRRDWNIKDDLPRKHLIVYNTFNIELDRKYSSEEIVDAIKDGIRDWSTTYLPIVGEINDLSSGEFIIDNGQIKSFSSEGISIDVWNMNPPNNFAVFSIKNPKNIKNTTLFNDLKLTNLGKIIKNEMGGSKIIFNRINEYSKGSILKINVIFYWDEEKNKEKVEDPGWTLLGCNSNEWSVTSVLCCKKGWDAQCDLGSEIGGGTVYWSENEAAPTHCHIGTIKCAFRSWQANPLHIWIGVDNA